MEIELAEAGPPGDSAHSYETALVLFRSGNDRLAHQAAKNLLERVPGHAGGMVLLLATAGGCGDEVTIGSALVGISGHFGRLLSIPEVHELFDSDLLAPVTRSQTFRAVFAPLLRKVQLETCDSADRATVRSIQEAVRDATVNSVLLGAPAFRAQPERSGRRALCLVDTATGETAGTLRGDLDLLVVGRGTEANIRLAHPSVSRRHLQIKQREEGWLVQDLSAAGGTLLNGKPVGDGWTFVQEGDELRVGHVTLDLLAVEDVAAPPPDEDQPAPSPYREDPTSREPVDPRRATPPTPPRAAAGEALGPGAPRPTSPEAARAPVR